jgi:hypothetical protein
MSVTMDIVELVIERNREQWAFDAWRTQLADARERAFREEIAEPEDEQARRLR